MDILKSASFWAKIIYTWTMKPLHFQVKLASSPWLFGHNLFRDDVTGHQQHKRKLNKWHGKKLQKNGPLEIIPQQKKSKKKNGKSQVCVLTDHSRTSKWLITMVIVSPPTGVAGPLPNGRDLCLINSGDPNYWWSSFNGDPDFAVWSDPVQV